MAATLVKTEIVFNTRDNSKTTTSTYESFDGFGTEVDGKSNRKYSQENGVYRYSGDVIEYFEGVGQTSGGGSGDIYSVDISTGSEPIETHPRFAQVSPQFWRLWEIWKQDKTNDLLKTANLISEYQSRVTNGYWDPVKLDQEPVVSLVTLWQRGTREYLAPKVVSRHQTSGAPSNLSRVGKIDSPPYTAGVNREWLFTGASSRYNVATGTFETTYEWLASGPKGWEDYIYGTGSG
jgi:hypothetical protein